MKEVPKVHKYISYWECGKYAEGTPFAAPLQAWREDNVVPQNTLVYIEYFHGEPAPEGEPEDPHQDIIKWMLDFLGEPNEGHVLVNW